VGSSQDGGASGGRIPRRKRPFDILKEYPSRPDDTDNLGGLTPEVSVGALSASCRGAVERAGKSRRNHVRNSSVLASGTGLHELTHVSKDRGGVEEPVVDASSQHALAVVVSLDISAAAPPEQVMGGEQPSTRSAE
jgi:hypothetical protein